MKRLLALVLLCGACSAYEVTVRMPGKIPSGHTVKQTSNMYFMGSIGDTLDAPCDPAIVETYRGPLDRLLTLFTLGIYSPGSVVTTCAVQAQAQARVLSPGTITVVPMP